MHLPRTVYSAVTKINNNTKLKLPIKLQLNSKKNFSLNLNIYRNAHYFTLNKAKVLYEEYLSSILDSLVPRNKIKLIYSLYYRDTARRVDISNICSIVDKFFSDCLVNKGLIPDDSFNYIPEIVYRFGGYIPKSETPYVEVEIVDINNEN